MAGTLLQSLHQWVWKIKKYLGRLPVPPVRVASLQQTAVKVAAGSNGNSLCWVLTLLYHRIWLNLQWHECHWYNLTQWVDGARTVTTKMQTSSAGRLQSQLLPKTETFHFYIVIETKNSFKLTWILRNYNEIFTASWGMNLRLCFVTTNCLFQSDSCHDEVVFILLFHWAVLISWLSKVNNFK